MSVRNRLGFTYHDAVTSDHEELAAALYLRGDVSGGVAFSRKMGAGRKIHNKKYIARQQVLDLFSWNSWPRELNILTFPGLKWEFERKLLGGRIQECRDVACGSTNIHSIECEQAIFRASLNWMPGFRGQGVRLVNHSTIATTLIQEYQCVGFEDYVSSPNFSSYYNAAWLDFTGFLTERRLAAIARLWDVSTSMQTLVVTLMNARQPKSITKQLKVGGTGHLFQRRLQDSKCVSEMTYADPTPMIQVVLARRAQ